MNNLENKTVLVTGASGFIGTHLVKRLRKVDGIQLLLLSREAHPSAQENATWLKGSLSDLTSEYWQQHGIRHIDKVFHFGAFTPKTGADTNNVARVFCDNLDGTRILLEGLPAGMECIVFASTLDVYAPLGDGRVLSEKSCVDPPGLYGASKLFCEKLVSEWARDKSCCCSILRYGHIFGPGEGAYGKLIPVVIRQLINGGAPTVYGRGNAERDFLYVEDAVEATIRAAVANRNVGPVNIVRGKSNPIKEIVEILMEEVGTPTKINFLHDKPDGFSLRFDNRMMIEELGSWPLVSLKDGLAEEVKTFKREING